MLVTSIFSFPSMFSIISGLIDRMVFYAAFNSISVISRQQLTLLMSFLGFTSTRLGLWSVLPKDTPTKNPRGSSAARTQDYESNTTTEPRRTPYIISRTNFAILITFVICKYFEFEQV